MNPQVAGRGWVGLPSNVKCHSGFEQSFGNKIPYLFRNLFPFFFFFLGGGVLHFSYLYTCMKVEDGLQPYFSICTVFIPFLVLSLQCGDITYNFVLLSTTNSRCHKYFLKSIFFSHKRKKKSVSYTFSGSEKLWKFSPISKPAPGTYGYDMLQFLHSGPTPSQVKSIQYSLVTPHMKRYQLSSLRQTGKLFIKIIQKSILFGRPTALRKNPPQ